MIFDFLGDLFFPRVCVACRSNIGVGAVCDACFAGIARNKHAQSSSFIYAAAGYDDTTLQALIHALKFQGVRDAAAALSALLVEYAIPLAECLRAGGYRVIPVPLSRRRERARGFNQSALIAGPFTKTLGLPFEKNLLVRTRHTEPQSETTSLAERTANLRGCFAVPDPSSIRGKRILLIDDVTTSGTTFLEASLALEAAGAAEIIALACAKA